MNRSGRNVSPTYTLAVVSLAVLATVYGNAPEYRFEVAAIVIDRVTLIAAEVLLAIDFRRDARTSAGSVAGACRA